ncbi:MAG: rhomboid family intramembrane serine protease [Planctomycetota bacterium]
MRHIGDLKTNSQAEAFLSFLLVQGIEGQSDASGKTVEIWIKEEDHFDRAVKELNSFKENPDAPKYAESIAPARQIVQQEERRKRKIQKRIISPAAGGRIGPSARLTPALVIICAIVAILTNFGVSKPDNGVHRSLQYTCVSFDSPRSATEFGKTLNQDSLRARTLSLQRGEIWRLVTPIFIHYGVFHIVFNMMWLVMLGSAIEKRYGIVNYGLLVLGTAIISNVIQCSVPVEVGGSPPQIYGSYIMTMLGGMSGVVCGLFGFVWMKSTYDPASRLRIPQSTVIIMMVYLVACIFGQSLNDAGLTFIPTNVANWAHFAGLGVGCAVGYWTSMRR